MAVGQEGNINAIDSSKSIYCVCSLCLVSLDINHQVSWLPAKFCTVLVNIVQLDGYIRSPLVLKDAQHAVAHCAGSPVVWIELNRSAFWI
jgi:hypothetical protein